MIVYFNGQFIPASQAKVSIFDRGFLYGDGLFETMRAYQGKIFALGEHLNRLQMSAKVMQFASLPGKTELIEATGETVKKNKLKEARVRLTVTRGAGSAGLATPEKITPTVLITASPLQPYGKNLYERGMRATFISQRRGGNSVIFQLKSTSYLASVLGKLEAQRRGADEGIFLSNQGEVTEGTVSNIFLVKDGSIFTPPGDSGILPGVTRQIICSLTKELSLELREESLWPEDVTDADEFFLTNSLMEVMPVTAVDEEPIGSGKPGPVTKQIHRAYQNYVTRKLGLLHS